MVELNSVWLRSSAKSSKIENLGSEAKAPRELLGAAPTIARRSVDTTACNIEQL